MAPVHPLVAMVVHGAGLYRKGTFAIVAQRQSAKTTPHGPGPGEAVLADSGGLAQPTV